MSHPIFRTVEAARVSLVATGHAVTVSHHPTSFGYSSYIKASRHEGNASVSVAARVSDHSTGEFRLATDDCSHLPGDITTECLIAHLTITDERLLIAVADVAARRAERVAAAAGMTKRQRRARGLL